MKTKGLKKITIFEYLQENCICDPDRNDFRSVCGFACHAKWHWSWEVARAKVKFNLGKRFNPKVFKSNLI